MLRAAKILNLNPETARMIYIKYSETGFFYVKNRPKGEKIIKAKATKVKIEENVQIKI